MNNEIRNYEAMRKAEARSLEPPETLDCDNCAENDFEHREQCGMNCDRRAEWVCECCDKKKCEC
jgi:hypothetical protein